MPWKERDVKNLRLEFVLRALSEGTSFGALCREYGIEPKTGYKWKQRFLREGAAGLEDRSRRPKSSPGQLDERVVCEIVRLKQAHPGWGPRKLRAVYARRQEGRVVPSESSFKRVLEKAGLVKKRRRRKAVSNGRLEQRRQSREPNDIWTVDFKGWWHTSEGDRCEPLTVRDDYSRYVLGARVPADGRTETIRAELERLFEMYGLPRMIRSDNGSPFASVQAPLGLSRLSVWWLALGIDVDRIEPGCPSQNGRHERMHRDLAAEVEGRVSGGLRAQQAALEVWRQSFNEERPHEALGMRCPAELYRKSERAYTGTPERLEYDRGYLSRRVQVTGKMRFRGAMIGISRALSGWEVGLKPIDDETWSVHFGHLCLGQIDLSTESFRPTERQSDQWAREGGWAARPPGKESSSLLAGFLPGCWLSASDPLKVLPMSWTKSVTDVLTAPSPPEIRNQKS
jgi:putative transposase